MTTSVGAFNMARIVSEKIDKADHTLVMAIPCFSKSTVNLFVSKFIPTLPIAYVVLPRSLITPDLSMKSRQPYSYVTGTTLAKVAEA